MGNKKTINSKYRTMINKQKTIADQKSMQNNVELTACYFGADAKKVFPYLCEPKIVRVSCDS